MDPHEQLAEAHALIFGVSRYRHIKGLPAGTRNGAEQLAAALSDPHLGGYDDEQVRLLVDHQVTRQRVLETLGELQACTGPESTVFLYFAGHGGQLADGSACLLTVDADNADSDTLARTSVSGAQLADALTAIPAGRMLVIFDCCHAGGLGAVDTPLGVTGGLPETYCQDLVAGRGRVVLASARSDERSWLPDSNSLSVFTQHLLAALRGAAGGSEGWLRAWDLFEYIQPRVTGDRPDQHPVFKAELEENFPIALCLGGQGGAPAATEDYPYDAYLSYADCEPDASWVWDQLVPQLEEAGLRIAVSGDVEDPGVFRVVGVERGITRARRTVAVLSAAYLADEMTGFIDSLAQTRGLEQGLAQLLPVRFGEISAEQLPARLRMLVALDLGHRSRGRRNFNRLVKALHAPLVVQ